MKLWINYKKEMVIASRGFYFYMEIFISLLILSVLMLVIPTESTAVAKEIIFPNLTAEQFEAMISKQQGEGYHERQEDVEFKLKPATITYTVVETGEQVDLVFEDTKTVAVKQYNYHDTLTGKHTKTKYFVDNFEDMIRISYDKKYIATEMWFGDDGLDYYNTVLFGYETERYQNIIKTAHGTVDFDMLASQMMIEEENVVYLEPIETLNNRQNILPLALVLMNGLMGMMIIIAYISVDKSDGIIKAMAVSPIRIGSYLLSKILVVLTTVSISSAIITIPVMGMQPNYLMFALSTISMTVLSCVVGALAGTFFADLKSSYSLIMIMAIVMMLPVLSFMVPAFNPPWMKFLPSYYMLESLKETLLVSCDVPFVVATSLAMLAGSGVLFIVANKRFKKILGM